MDKFIGIFQQLGVDSSIFIQFGIFAILFFVLKATLFNKLLFVLQLRESKTTKLAEGANQTAQNADSLLEEYNLKISSINAETHARVSNSKKDIKKEEEIKMKEAVNNILSDYEKKKNEIVSKANAQSEELLSNSSHLIKELTGKFLN